MAFPDTQNVPTSPIVAPANPGDSTLAQTISGMSAGTCSPGIGIATAERNPVASGWSANTRNPVPGQYIGWGGDSIETGQLDADIPDLKIVDYYTGPDFNDTAIFAQVDTAVSAKNAVFDTVTGAALASELANPTVIGEWQWGRVPVV